jgi:hypothetical protein
MRTLISRWKCFGGATQALLVASLLVVVATVYGNLAY